MFIDMFIGSYWRLKKDFMPILEQKGYIYSYKLKHNVSPAIEFKKGKKGLTIGYDYSEDYIYVNIHDSDDSDIHGITLVDENTFSKKKFKHPYEEQLPIVKQILIKSL